MPTYQQFKTDENLEVNGVVFDIRGSGKFRVARLGGANKKWQLGLERRMRPYRKQIQQGTLSEDVAREALTLNFVDTALLGWEGVTGPDGKELPFNRANAVKLFTDLPDLFESLREAATDHSPYLELVEEDAKN